VNDIAERLLATRSQIYRGPQLPLIKSAEEGGCGVTGFACTVPLAGRFIYEPSVQMQNRGNGKGGGIAAVGLVPEQMGVPPDVLQNYYLLQIALLDPSCHADLERRYILPNFDVAISARQPHIDDYRDIPGLDVRPRTYTDTSSARSRRYSMPLLSRADWKILRPAISRTNSSGGIHTG
jgi:hypothetical protein